MVAASPSDQTIDSFYAARGGRPLWLANGSNAPHILLDLLRSSAADGIASDQFPLRDLDRALGQLSYRNQKQVLQADHMLSQVFTRYVGEVRRIKSNEMIWVDPGLRPSAAFPRTLLDEVAAAPSLDDYLTGMRWMNPIYAGLRQAIAAGADNRRLLALNLERARALPAINGRYILVNSSAAQLTMYERGVPVDSMRVVVGKPIYPTPVMAALVRFASLNPYWNVPPDLAAERIAPNVIKDGKAYLKLKGYQLLSSWDDNPTVVDPATVDWKAIAAGKQEVRIRQLPGPANAMGRMKFMFPNAQGVYLHDTPEKALLGEETRMFSGGCVRLEDAPRLARWLFNGKSPSTRSASPEQRIDLPTPVPVFLTYLTAVPTDHGIAYLPDVYHRDQPALATMEQPKVATR